MAADPNKNFVVSPPPYVVIPYSEYEKVVNMANELIEIRQQYKRLQEQYAAIRGMFSECLDVVREIREFVKDS